MPFVSLHPQLNLTMFAVPDTSPLIVYANGLWHDSSHDDSDWDRYENGTFHATQDNVSLVLPVVSYDISLECTGSNRFADFQRLRRVCIWR